MKSQFARLALFASLFALLCSALFIINQTAQVVSLATAISPMFGKIVLAILALAFSVILLVPLAMIARMPAALRPPIDTDSADYQTYLLRLGERLAKNPHLSSTRAQLCDRAGIEAALRVLDARADECIKATASSIFVSTAISQNGKLDALMVLAAQTRMIWQVARVYNQRPMPREMIRLYGNVGVTLFAASALEDIDITDQVAPVIHAALGSSLVSILPGITHISSLVTHSVVEGAANAYLTLRVGVICRTYCASLANIDPKPTRRYASFTAASMLGAIVGGSAATVAKAILAAARKAGVSTVGSTAAGIQKAGARLNPFKHSDE